MKISKKRLYPLLLSGATLFLSACRRTTEPLGPSSTGIWDRFILLPLSEMIVWLSDHFGGYGMGIIIFTIIIRLLLIPLYRMQTKSMRKMHDIQPELDQIKEKYPNKDRESREAMQREQMQLMEDRDVNQFASLIPVVIQLPVMLALYQAILRTDVLRTGHFLWMNLGQRDPYFILPIVAAALAFWNTYLTMKSNPMKNSATQAMTFVMPGMILLITIGLPSAIALYFVVSNAFTVAQTLLLNNPYKIIEEREAKEAEKRERERLLRRELRRATGRKKK